MRDFRLLAAKKIELELKVSDEDKFNLTMEELCRESSPNNLWLKCTLNKWMSLGLLILTHFSCAFSNSENSDRVEDNINTIDEWKWSWIWYSTATWLISFDEKPQ